MLWCAPAAVILKCPHCGTNKGISYLILNPRWARTNTRGSSLDVSLTPRCLRRSVVVPQPGVTRPPPSAAAPLLGLSWWVWLTAGGGCLAVVLLVVFVVVLCERIKRKVSHENLPGSLHTLLPGLDLAGGMKWDGLLRQTKQLEFDFFFSCCRENIKWWRMADRSQRATASATGKCSLLASIS